MKMLSMDSLTLLNAGASSRRCVIFGGLVTAGLFFGPAGWLASFGLAGAAVNEGCFDEGAK